MLALFTLNPLEMVIILGLGVLLFGRKLPEVGRYVGKGIVEFRKGLRGLEDDIETPASYDRPEAKLEAPRPPQRVTATTPKFEDAPAAKPVPPTE